MDKIINMFIFVILLTLTPNILTARPKISTLNLFQVNVLDNVDVPVIAHSKLSKDVVFNDRDMDDSSLEDSSEEQDYIPQKYHQHLNKNKMLTNDDLIDSILALKKKQPRYEIYEFVPSGKLQAKRVGNANDSRDVGSEMFALRKSWYSSCNRKAAKACQKACKQALKNTCKKFNCKRNEKKSFKKDCKSICNEKFDAGSGSGSGSSEDES